MRLFFLTVVEETIRGNCLLERKKRHQGGQLQYTLKDGDTRNTYTPIDYMDKVQILKSVKT